MVRTRFAPSPTGFVHIGSLRTALFAYLFAKHHSGDIILRVEDTDRTRLVEGAVDNLLKVMHTVGIHFDEGFYLDETGHVKERGEHGPYLQSERLTLYQKHALELIEKGHAYYCFCSEQRLEDLRKEQTALKKPPMYDGHCRNLSQEEVQSQMQTCHAEGRNPVVRAALPKEGQTVIQDEIYGEISYENKVLDDQVILKSDGFPTYHLAVVVDDHYMGITHVIRGEEWIPSTPKHLLLYQFFGWQTPKHAHLPLILNPDKSKLSKRQGDVAVEDFLKNGYLPEALINFVVFLGWNPKTSQELFTMEELIKEFSLEKINKAAPVFDVTKLDWINSQYIRRMPVGELAQKLKPFWQAVGTDTSKYSDDYLTAIAKLEQERLKKLSEIGESTKYFFERLDYAGETLIWKKADAAVTKKVLQDLHTLLEAQTDLSQEQLDSQIKNYIATSGLDNGTVYWPLRMALTGMQKSPPPVEVAATLALGPGKAEILQRLAIAISKL